MAARLQAIGQRNYVNGFSLTLQPQMLNLPLTWKKPQRIFVNSMSDLFHADVPVEYIRQVFDVMTGARQIDPSWVTDIRDQCLVADVPFFFKQWGGTNKKVTGRVLEGRGWNEMPAERDVTVVP